MRAKVGAENAAWLADSGHGEPGKSGVPGITDNGDGSVSFGDAALKSMRELSPEADGSIDHGYLWIGGTGYAVSR